MADDNSQQESELPAWEERSQFMIEAHYAFIARKRGPAIIISTDNITTIDDTVPMEPARPKMEDGILRLSWALQGSVAESISVMPSAYNETPLIGHEPYLIQTESGTCLHAISQQLLVEPPISSIKVEMDTLNSIWADWLEIHEKCNYQGQVLRPLNNKDDPEDADTEDEDGNPAMIKRCGCGEYRPSDDAHLIVHASSSKGITIEDYVDAVHPWLMLRRQIIFEALHLWDGPLQNTNKMLVSFFGPDSLHVEEELDWVAMKKSSALPIRITYAPEY